MPGNFRLSAYESDEGTIHLIKIQGETNTADIGGVNNSAPTGAVDSPFAAEVNRGARAYGLRPRKINVAFTDQPPTGYRPYCTLSIPVLKESVYSGAAVGDEVEYAGGSGKVKSKIAESVNPGEDAVGLTAEGDEDEEGGETTP